LQGVGTGDWNLGAGGAVFPDLGIAIPAGRRAVAI